MSIRLQIDVDNLKKDVEVLNKKVGDLDKATLLEVMNLLRAEVKKLHDKVTRLEKKSG